MTGNSGNDEKLPCGCSAAAIAAAKDATGMALHPPTCGILKHGPRTGLTCTSCYHDTGEHNRHGCQHKMPREDWCEGQDDPDVYCDCIRVGSTAHRCRTCGGEINATDSRCTCWTLLADALQRYAGYGHDDSAQRAADLWDDTGDHERVWAGNYLDETMPGNGTPDSIVAALARMDYPAESESGDCLLCDIAGNGCWQWHHTSCDGGCRRRTGKVCNEDEYTGGGGRMVQNPSPSEPSSHRTDCPWRQAKEWAAR